MQHPAVGLRLPGALPQFPWVVQQEELGPEILGRFVCQLLLILHTQPQLRVSRHLSEHPGTNLKRSNLLLGC